MTQRYLVMRYLFIYLSVPDEWRRLHNEELSDLYFSRDIICVVVVVLLMMMMMVGACDISGGQHLCTQSFGAKI
jgi:hypothetical protein